MSPIPGYRVVEVSSGMYVYANVRPTPLPEGLGLDVVHEPPHWICPSCASKKRTSILVRREISEPWECVALCGFDLDVDDDVVPEYA